MLIDILEDNTISIHSKKVLLENYPRFVTAVDDPNTLVSRRSASLFFK
jgi:hypothetical protein